MEIKRHIDVTLIVLVLSKPSANNALTADGSKQNKDVATKWNGG
jgi:hypothetical protein